MNEKPISMTLREVKQNLIQLLNESNLSIDILDMILTEIATQVHNQAEMMYQQDMKSYQAKNNTEEVEEENELS